MLDGLKALDLTHYVAGPYATRMMAAQGAEVIKVERPGVGDPSRRIGPFPDDVPHPEKSAPFLYLNTGKKSITLNLKHSASKPIIHSLLEWADVLVENFRPGVMERLGLDYESVAAVNPGLVMTSVSNFGQTGPYRDYGAREINLYAMGGLMYITGRPGAGAAAHGGAAGAVRSGAERIRGHDGRAAAQGCFGRGAACGCGYLGVSGDYTGERAEPV